MAHPDVLLVFDETVTRAGVEGWIRHLESAGAPTQMYRLGASHVLPVSEMDVAAAVRTAGAELPALTAVALWKQRTHLPVMADPSHSGGRPELVEPLSLAAIAAGADALLIDVHVQPKRALCDGNQALSPARFAELMRRLANAATGLGRRMTEVNVTMPTKETPDASTR